MEYFALPMTRDQFSKATAALESNQNVTKFWQDGTEGSFTVYDIDFGFSYDETDITVTIMKRGDNDAPLSMVEETFKHLIFAAE